MEYLKKKSTFALMYKVSGHLLVFFVFLFFFIKTFKMKPGLLRPEFCSLTPVSMFGFVFDTVSWRVEVT